MKLKNRMREQEGAECPVDIRLAPTEAERRTPCRAPTGAQGTGGGLREQWPIHELHNLMTLCNNVRQKYYEDDTLCGSAS